MIRSVVSVVAGFFTFTFATLGLWTVFGYGPNDTPPDSFLVGSLICEIFICLGAGYLTALIAGRKKRVMRSLSVSPWSSKESHLSSWPRICIRPGCRCPRCSCLHRAAIWAG